MRNGIFTLSQLTPYFKTTVRKPERYHLFKCSVSITGQLQCRYGQDQEPHHTQPFPEMASGNHEAVPEKLGLPRSSGGAYMRLRPWVHTPMLSGPSQIPDSQMQDPKRLQPQFGCLVHTDHHKPRKPAGAPLQGSPITSVLDSIGQHGKPRPRLKLRAQRRFSKVPRPQESPGSEAFVFQRGDRRTGVFLGCFFCMELLSSVLLV